MNRLFILLATVFMALSTTASELPGSIYSGLWKAGHVQGIAVDAKKEYMYFSFTTILVKTDLKGNIIGTVTGLLGHLGCLEYNEQDGRVYGSLEYKGDSIGQGILKRENYTKELQDGFYIAIFDVNKITRMDMNAEKDGIMTSVYLPTVLEDYKATVKTPEGEKEHRFACSGIDGVSFGPEFGSKDPKRYLMVAYGIYGDTKRSDNNYQVILQYDTRDWTKYEAPLSQESMHRNGPKKPLKRYFLYTGNTNWGIQNMEYDWEKNLWFAFAYKGKKEQYPNYTLFAIDGNVKPYKTTLSGIPYQKKGSVLTLAKMGKHDPQSNTYGWHFDKGTTGFCFLGDNMYYISNRKKSKDGQQTWAKLYRFTGAPDKPFELVK